MNDPKRIRIGVASSIAAANHFSWGDTVDFAANHNLDVIQLYINPARLNRDMSTLNRYRDAHGIDCIFHLPPKLPEKQMMDSVASNLKKNIILIQHDQFLDDNTLNWFRQNPDYILGLENDYPEEMNHFMETLNYLIEQEIRCLPVLDLPRFYHQNKRNLPLKKLEVAIRNVVHRVNEVSKNILIHLIDSDGRQDERNNWKVLFEGSLPLRELMKEILQLEGDLMIILEYESPQMTLKSLRNLKAFLNKKWALKS